MEIKISECWLKEWIQKDIPYKKLINQMNKIGLEINSIKKVSESFFGVLIGRIVYLQKYKNYFRIKIDIGEKKLFTTFSNDKSCSLGLKVAFAPIGTKLPNRIEVKKKKFYNFFSEGILCSFNNLLINIEKKEKIIIFSKKAKIGTDVYKYLKLYDHTISLNIALNRFDCFSIFGIARELSIINNSLISNFNKKNIIQNKEKISIKIKNFPQCPRYVGRIIKNININKEIPLSIQEKLRRCEIKSINPIIDIANYVCLEIGQPIFIFDLDEIKSGITIRYSQEKEKFFLLNNTEIILNEKTLVTADSKKILALSGITNSIFAFPNLKTKNIFVECAYFTPESILNRSKLYKIISTNSYRYEKGINPYIQRKSIEYITNLIVKIFGGNIAPIIEKYKSSFLPKKNKIYLSLKKTRNVLGFNITTKEIVEILKKIGCKLDKDRKLFLIKPPFWRSDLLIEEDLIEEIARIIGYENIPLKSWKGKLYINSENLYSSFLKNAKTTLVKKGYQEVISYSFIDPILQKILFPDRNKISVPKPISIEMSEMRISLINGLLSILIYNQNYQENYFRIFESGLCFIPDSNYNLGIQQKLMLSGLIYDNKNFKFWDNSQIKKTDFYDIKGDLESILEIIFKLESIDFKNKNVPIFLHPGKSAVFYYKNNQIGFLGKIHPSIQKKLEIKGNVFLFEFFLDNINLNKKEIPKINKISKFPINRRDICITIPNNIPVSSLLFECKKFISKDLIDIKLFDVYQGENIKNGYKSISIALMIQNQKKVLEDKEITDIVKKCIKLLNLKFQASLRD